MSEPKPSHPGHHHRKHAIASVPTAIVSVSDTRTLETDAGGKRIEELLAAAGHPVTGREVVRDEPDAIRGALERSLLAPAVRAVIFREPASLRPRRHAQALEPLLGAILASALFRMLSWQDVGSAALPRARGTPGA
jgi:molybdenum cofactor biosynthesis protein B